MSQQESKHKRPSFSDEFKRDAVNLIVNQGYSFRAAADAVGVGEGILCLGPVCSFGRQMPADGPAGDARRLSDPPLRVPGSS